MAGLQKKASASVLSTPGSALPELSGICLHFPKKSKLAANQLTPFGSTALAHLTLSPQRKGDSPKKRAQLNQAPTSTPPHEHQATPASSTSGSWSSLDDESEEDLSAEESEEEDSIDQMVLNWAQGHLVPPRGTVTNVQDCFCFPHVFGIPPEVTPGVKPRFRSLNKLSNGTGSSELSSIPLIML